MSGTDRIQSPVEFSRLLFEGMKLINSGIKSLHLTEFRYALENLLPGDGWGSIRPEEPETIERLVKSRNFYENIQLMPRDSDRIVLDNTIAHLTRVLFIGLVEGVYSVEWIIEHFYFDIRSFIFFPRTTYYTDDVLTHFGKQPYRTFEKKQQLLEGFQDVGYQDFMQANAEIDQAFIEGVKKIIAVKGTPVLMTLAGPTAAGKTEITERLVDELKKRNRTISTIEVDNFLLDRNYRENKPMGKESTHFNLFCQSLELISQGKKVAIPRYDFVNATSSHDLAGNLRPGCVSLEIMPADIIFMEGNFPFHTDEISRLIGIKIVYLTDDPVRLKRKWKRDIDYRKKYDPAYFRNRFFKTQFLRAEDVYRPLMQVCDLIVDTTGASLWATEEIMNIFDK